MILRSLLEIDRALDRIQQKLEKLMATAQDLKTVLKQIDDETTRIANKFDELFAKVSAGGMSEQEEAAAITEAQNLAERLRKLGHDPAQPVPTETQAPSGD